ncbi:MAG: hypothetical protein IJ608_05775 [Lachnospiraceae bacterium]|nr:hypothetical protein [Lachnospiraceae bacterium]
MEKIIYVILFGFMAAAGGLSTAYIVVSLPVVLVFKLYRRIKYGTSLWN